MLFSNRRLWNLDESQIETVWSSYLWSQGLWTCEVEAADLVNPVVGHDQVSEVALPNTPTSRANKARIRALQRQRKALRAKQTC